VSPDSQDRANRRQNPADIPQELERRSAVVRELELRIERRAPNHVVIHVAHEFVAQNRYLFDETLERLCPQKPGARIEIDLSRVPYADSEALGRLQSWSRRLAQSSVTFVVVNPTPYVAGIFQLLRMDTALTIIHRHAYPA